MIYSTIHTLHVALQPFQVDDDSSDYALFAESLIVTLAKHRSLLISYYIMSGEVYGSMKTKLKLKH